MKWKDRSYTRRQESREGIYQAKDLKLITVDTVKEK